MRLQFFVKFANCDPKLVNVATFEDFWHQIREDVLRGYRLEWIIEY